MPTSEILVGFGELRVQAEKVFDAQKELKGILDKVAGSNLD
jgi:hypothetical protein